ncbi:MAG: hypothetical protein ACREYB_07625 [Casimicrobiaceae bacterium]
MTRIMGAATRYLVATAVIALLAAVLINLRDEEISPQARAMTGFAPPAVADESNAYVALLGLSAPPGIEPLAEGLQLVADRDEATTGDPFARERIAHDAPDPDASADDRIAVQGDRDASCDIFNEPCLPFAKARAGAVRTLLADNALLTERYLRAQKLPAFASIAIADKDRANAERSNLEQIHALLLTNAALSAQQRNATDACDFLLADGSFWRRVLSSGGTALADKLLAFRALSEDVRLGSEMIAAAAFDSDACAPSFRTLLIPLTGDERSLANAFRIAFRPAVHMLASWPDPALSVEPESWPDRYLKETPVYDLFYRRNASINRCARLFAALEALAAAPAPRFAAARDTFLGETSDLSSPGPRWIYNPLGNLLLGRHLTFYVDYVAHAHGVAAYIALVRAQLELRLAGVPPKQVPGLLEHGGPDFKNPFDGRPFSWNPDRRTLSFDALDRRWRRWGATVPITVPEPAAAAPRAVPAFATMTLRR